MELQGSTILICDDSRLVRKKLKDQLEARGCKVLEAQNGQEGLEIYKVQKPQVVFMDIVMPVIDGLEALKRLRDIDSSAKIIMLSSTGTAAKLKQAIDNGAKDFIQKPYDEAQIFETLSKV